MWKTVGNKRKAEESQDKGIRGLVPMERLRNRRVNVYKNTSLGSQDIPKVQCISFSWINFSNEH